MSLPDRVLPVGRFDPETGEIVVFGTTTVPARELVDSEEISKLMNKDALGFKPTTIERLAFALEQEDKAAERSAGRRVVGARFMRFTE